MKTSRSFSSDPAATRSARHFVLHAVGQAPPGVRDAIAVMIGELAMNAVQHAQTGFGVTVELVGGTLRVEVTDSGGNYPAPGRCRRPAARAVAVCRSWTVSPTPGASHGHPQSRARPSGSRSPCRLAANQNRALQQAWAALARLVCPAQMLAAGSWILTPRWKGGNDPR